MIDVSRRQLLAALVAGASLPLRALAFGTVTQVAVCELDLGSGTASRPLAWKRLLYELQGTTSVETAPSSVQLKPDDRALFDYPFCVLHGDGAFAMPSDAALDQLSRYLAYGGFIVVDDHSGADRSPFVQSATELFRRLFPTRSFSPLPSDHSIFRSFFMLERPVGRVARFSQLDAITVGDFAPVVLHRNDMSGALDRGNDGRPRHACVPDGERQRRESVKLGINLVMYALTANYKRDLAHVRELQKQGRLE